MSSPFASRTVTSLGGAAVTALGRLRLPTGMADGLSPGNEAFPKTPAVLGSAEAVADPAGDGAMMATTLGSEEGGAVRVSAILASKTDLAPAVLASYCVVRRSNSSSSFSLLTCAGQARQA